ncbi:serine hydrolase [Patescibacteria group bacterium]|nr:serine hydrolase [Patescibacteria group bacterium]
MKTPYLIIFIISLLLPVIKVGAVDQQSLTKKLSGKILLQVESYGRAWYVNPDDQTRYYLKNGEEAYNIMRTLSLGITNQDLEKIPTQTGQNYDKKLTERLKGKILLQVESRGEAWYVNPVDGIRYYLKDGKAAYQLMREFALGISNTDLQKIQMNDQQITFDAAWDGVAYTALDNNEYLDSLNSDLILPLASLTKLMTALVFLDINPDWQKTVTITKEQIDYPKTLVGEDTTSEIDLEIGDQIKINDLWISMLLASSNQAAVILADNSGLSRTEFIQRMNDKAKELNLNKTAFFDVAGLDSHNVSTAKEFAKLAQTAFAIDKIAQATNLTEYTFTCLKATNENKQINVHNRNYSLLQFEPNASKTGFLVEAQRNVALQKDDHLIIVLHARSMKERNDIIENLLNQ